MTLTKEKRLPWVKSLTKHFSKSSEERREVDHRSEAPSSGRIPSVSDINLLLLDSLQSPSTQTQITHLSPPRLEEHNTNGNHAIQQPQSAVALIGPSRPRKTNHYQAVGRFLVNLPDNSGKLWDLPDSLLSEQILLQHEVEDCLAHCDLPKKVICNYYLKGRTEHKAWAVILVWGGDAEARKRAKNQLSTEVLILPQFKKWRVMLASSNPVLPQIRALRQYGDAPADANKQSVTLWYDAEHDTVAIIYHGSITHKPDHGPTALPVQFGIPGATYLHKRGSIVGAFAIGNKDYLLASAHVFTGTSVFAGTDLASSEPFSNEEDSEDESEDDEMLDMLHNSYAAVRLPTAKASRASQRSVPELDSSRDLRPQQQNITLPDFRGPFVAPLPWPDETIEMWYGAFELDYALITMPLSLTFPFTKTLIEHEWFISDTDDPPLLTKVYINCFNRRLIEGTLLLTSFRLKGQSYWVYWPAEQHTPRNHIRPGDSGLLLCDSQYVFGLVVAGCSNGAAIVVPSHRIVRDITQQRFSPPVLSTEAMIRAREAEQQSSMSSTMIEHLLEPAQYKDRLKVLLYKYL